MFAFTNSIFWCKSLDYYRFFSNIISSSTSSLFIFFFKKRHLCFFFYFLQRVWSVQMYVMITFLKFYFYVTELNFQWNILSKCWVKNAISVQIKLLQHMFEKSSLIWRLAKKNLSIKSLIVINSINQIIKSIFFMLVQSSTLFYPFIIAPEYPGLSM